MKKIILVALASVGLVACSNNKGSNCDANAKVVSTQSARSEVPALNSRNQLVIPPDARETYSMREMKIVLNSGKVIQVDREENTDGETFEAEEGETATVIDFNTKTISGDGDVARFAQNSQMSKTKGKATYQVDEATLVGLMGQFMLTGEENSEDLTFCAIDSASLSFSYNPGDSEIERNIGFTVSVRLSQRLLDYYNNNDLDSAEDSEQY